jgi:hypothetical protein
MKDLRRASISSRVAAQIMSLVGLVQPLGRVRQEIAVACGPCAVDDEELGSPQATCTQVTATTGGKYSGSASGRKGGRSQSLRTVETATFLPR